MVDWGGWSPPLPKHGAADLRMEGSGGWSGHVQFRTERTCVPFGMQDAFDAPLRHARLAWNGLEV